MTAQQTDFEAAYAAGRAVVQNVNGMPFVVVPHDAKNVIFPDLLAAPLHVAQTVQLSTVAAFNAYVNRFADNNSVIFVDIPGGKIKAVLDYHKAEPYSANDGNATPRHGKHIATLHCQYTTEFEKIRAASGKKFSQEDFALFLEDIIPHIAHPDAATLQEIVGTLEAKTNVDFKSGIRTDNGQVSLQYSETIEAKAGVQGTLAVPQSITFGLQVHRGGKAYKLPARFRYRISGGNLTLWYDIDQLDHAIETSMNDTVSIIKHGQIDDAAPATEGDVYLIEPAKATVFEGTV